MLRLTLSAITIASSVLILSLPLTATLMYSYLFIRQRDRCLGIWAASGLLLFLHSIFELSTIIAGRPGILLVVSQLSLIVSISLLYWGSQLFFNRKLPRIWIYIGFAGVAWIVFSAIEHVSFLWSALPEALFVGTACTSLVVAFMRYKKNSGIAGYITIVALIALAVVRTGYPFVRFVDGFGLWGHLSSTFLFAASAAGITLLYLNDVKVTLWRNKKSDLAEGSVLGSSERKLEDFEEIASSESERNHRKIFEYISEGIAMCKLVYDDNGEPIDFVVIDANPSSEAITGIKVQDSVGKKITEIFPTTEALFIDVFAGVAATGEPAEFETFFEPIGKHFNVSSFSTGADEFAILFRDVTEEKRAYRELEFQSMLLNQVNDSVFVFNREGRFLYVNEAAHETRGYSRDELMNMTIYELKDNAETALISEQFERLEREGSLIFDSAHRGKDGIVMDVEIHANLVEGDGEFLQVAVVRDMSERKLIERALKESERQFRSLLENMKLVSIMLDMEGTVTFCNDFLIDLTGWTHAELLGYNWFDVVVPEDLRDQVRSSFESAAGNSEATHHAEYDILTSSGERRTISFSGCLLRDPFGNIAGVASIGEDVTERKQAEEKLNYLAYNDTLTSLPNRTFFSDRLDRIIAHSQRENDMMAVAYLDLDSFRTINDTLGYEAGNELLRQVATRLTGYLGKENTLARFGGDELAFLVTGVSCEEDVSKIAEEIAEVLSPPFMISGRELHMTASIGISLYPADGDDSQTLLKNAEVALYRAKDRGKNTYRLYSPTMDAKALEMLAIENSMRKAVEREEFELYYQPQVALDSGEIVGVEALLRWHSKDHGMVSPAVFIPIAEETGLILSIGEWVLQEACRQSKAWLDAGYPPIRMSVNLSARQFQHHNLVEMVDRVLEETGLPPELLDIEITESAVMTDANKAIDILNEIEKRGIHISMDDFGTGYSSLGYLKRFPIDRLKIDKMFIDAVITDKSDAAIVSATIAMAKSLGMRSVAEGVETEEQLGCLQSLGCNEMQGYLFSRPLPAAEATKVLAQPPAHLDGFWAKRNARIA